MENSLLALPKLFSILYETSMTRVDDNNQYLHPICFIVTSYDMFNTILRV